VRPAAATTVESGQCMLALRPVARLANVSSPVTRLVSLEMVELLCPTLR
jgi:hypothetical protein